MIAIRGPPAMEKSILSEDTEHETPRTTKIKPTEVRTAASPERHAMTAAASAAMIASRGTADNQVIRDESATVFLKYGDVLD